MNRRISIYNKYQEIAHNLSNKIASEPDGFILGTPIDDLVDYYYSNNHFTPVKIDPERTELIDIKKERKIVQAHLREGPFQNQGDLPYDFESVVVHIPIKPHPQLDTLKNLEPSSMSTGFLGNELKWTNDALVFEVGIRGYGYDKQDDAVNQELKQSIEWVHNRLHSISPI